MVYSGCFDATLRIRDAIKSFATAGSSIPSERNLQCGMKLSFTWVKNETFCPIQEMPQHFLHPWWHIASSSWLSVLDRESGNSDKSGILPMLELSMSHLSELQLYFF